MAKDCFGRFDSNHGCLIEATVSLIDGKWKCVVLFHLLNDTRRFSEIRRLIPDVTQRMLTSQLRELEADGFIERKVYAQVPPKVEYSLTPLGKSLEPVLCALRQWGDRNTAVLLKRAASGAQASKSAAKQPRLAIAV
jgi:DNA-binding HxlR family transcriptional regulator